jgi:hypothetical protein
MQISKSELWERGDLQKIKGDRLSFFSKQVQIFSACPDTQTKGRTKEPVQR